MRAFSPFRIVAALVAAMSLSSGSLVAACASTPKESPIPSAEQQAHSGHGSPETQSGDSEESDAPADSHGCSLVMACGIAMSVTLPTQLLFSPILAAAADWRHRAGLEVDRTPEPPPPRFVTPL